VSLNPQNANASQIACGANEQKPAAIAKPHDVPIPKETKIAATPVAGNPLCGSHNITAKLSASMPISAAGIAGCGRQFAINASCQFAGERVAATGALWLANGSVMATYITHRYVAHAKTAGAPMYSLAPPAIGLRTFGFVTTRPASTVRRAFVLLPRPVRLIT
jgi:hypothetical protein